MKRNVVGGLLVGFILFLIMGILSLFFNLGVISKIIYIILLLIFILLFGIFLKKYREIDGNKEEVYQVKNKLTILYLIPLFFLLYLVYFHFIGYQEVTYFYDIGSEADLIAPLLLGDRSSEPFNTIDNVSYRNLESPLIYFKIPTLREFDDIIVQIRFKKDSLSSDNFKLGIKDNEEYHYSYSQPDIQTLINSDSWEIAKWTFKANE